MATLQKIRNRGGVLVSIVIGLALVAFIVGDALSSGASLINRSRNKVGEVGGETIGIQEYQQKIMKNEDFIKSMNMFISMHLEIFQSNLQRSAFCFHKSLCLCRRQRK